MNSINSLKSEIRDGMSIDWDVPIEMDDGLKVRCDIYKAWIPDFSMSVQCADLPQLRCLCLASVHGRKLPVQGSDRLGKFILGTEEIPDLEMREEKAFEKLWTSYGPHRNPFRDTIDRIYFKAERSRCPLLCSEAPTEK